MTKQEGITRVVLNLNRIIRDLASALCNALMLVIRGEKRKSNTTRTRESGM